MNEFLNDNPASTLGSAELYLGWYRQFLAVKKSRKDWDGTLLSPSYLVDGMWQLHRQMRGYKYDMMLLCGHDLCRSEGDASVLAARERTTIDAIRDRFGATWDIMSAVWNSLPVRIYECGQTVAYQFGCLRSSQISEVVKEFIEVYQQDERRDGIDFEFYYEQKRINGIDTPAMLGMSGCNNNLVEAIRKDHIKIIVRHSKTGHEEAYKTDRSAMLRLIVDRVAEKIKMTKFSLVFLTGGKLIFGHEHPREFSLDNYDVIEVVPAEEYRSHRCICCNPGLGPFAVG